MKTTTVRPGERSTSAPMDAIVRDRAQQGRDQENVDRAQRIQGMRGLPVWVDLIDLTARLYAEASMEAERKVGPARDQAIGKMEAYREWWDRLKMGEDIGRAAMTKLIARRFKPGGETA